MDLGIFVKEPVPGRVKRRLARAVGDQRACELYETFVRATFRLAEASRLPWRVFYTPAGAESRLRGRFCIAARMICQRGATLGVRMKHAFEEMLAESPAAMLIGSDSPTLPAAYLRRGRNLLKTRDLVLGPAEDGGYYLIGLTRMGLNKAKARLFSRIRWGRSGVFQTTLSRARRLRIRTGVLPAWYDIDTVEGLRRAMGQSTGDAAEANEKAQFSMLNVQFSSFQT